MTAFVVKSDATSIAWMSSQIVLPSRYSRKYGVPVGARALLLLSPKRLGVLCALTKSVQQQSLKSSGRVIKKGSIWIAWWIESKLELEAWSFSSFRKRNENWITERGWHCNNANCKAWIGAGTTKLLTEEEDEGEERAYESVIAERRYQLVSKIKSKENRFRNEPATQILGKWDVWDLTTLLSSESVASLPSEIEPIFGWFYDSIITLAW